MANGSSLRTWLDLQNNPLGTNKGENFNVPANYRIPEARIYVVNHSRTRSWKKLMVAVSARRGAEEALIYDKELAKIYNVDTLTKRVADGQNMNRYKTDVFPCVFSFQVGAPVSGGKPIVYAIPPARDEKSAPPRVEVVEGAWDLFLGNYQRMRSEDARVRGDEASRLALAWGSRHNPVMGFTDDGKQTLFDNPHGFIEFIREPITATQQVVDREYLDALSIVEV